MMIAPALVLNVCPWIDQEDTTAELYVIAGFMLMAVM